MSKSMPPGQMDGLRRGQGPPLRSSQIAPNSSNHSFPDAQCIRPETHDPAIELKDTSELQTISCSAPPVRMFNILQTHGERPSPPNNQAT